MEKYLSTALNLITLQYRIMHRVFTCNLNLHTWGIKPSPDCILCGQIDHLEHYFYYCKEVIYDAFSYSRSRWSSLIRRVGECSRSVFQSCG